MPTPDDVLKWFRDNDGLGESRRGSNCNAVTQGFFIAADRPRSLGTGCFEWCAAAVSLAVNTAFGDPDRWQVPGVRSTFSSGTAHVGAMQGFFAEAGRFDRGEPRPGDIVFFSFDGPMSLNHVGVFEEDLHDGTCLTREGNTGANRVEQKRRPFSVIEGYGRLPLSQEEDMTTDQADTLRFIAQVLTELKAPFERAGNGDFFRGLDKLESLLKQQA